MRKHIVRRRITGEPQQATQSTDSSDLMAMKPNGIRDGVLKALAALPIEQRNSMRDALFAGLRSSGIHIEGVLLILGIPAETPDDLSPSDIAKLIRYVQMNSPDAIRNVRDDLAKLLALSHAGETLAKPS